MVEVAPTAFGQVILFLDGLGFVSIVLPFLLVFAITYAILEKTKLLGENQSNLNAIVTFTIAFFVIASAPLVNILEDVLAKTILLIIGGVAIMITISVFTEKTHWFSFAVGKDGKYEDPRAGWIFTSIIFFVALIFLGAIKIDFLGARVSLLEIGLGWIINNYQTGLISSILLFGLLLWGVNWMSKSE